MFISFSPSIFLEWKVEKAKMEKKGETRIRQNGYNMNHKNDELLDAPFLFLAFMKNEKSRYKKSFKIDFSMRPKLLF